MTKTSQPGSRATAVTLALALAAGGAVALSSPADAAPPGGALLYGLTSENSLVSIRTGSGVVSTAQPVSGLDVGDVLVGIDVRPATGLLYGVARGAVSGDDSLYVLSTATGAATKVGSALTTRLDPAATTFGVDINPVADAVRVVASTGQNLAVSITTGAVTVQTPLTNPGLLQPVPSVAGAAYTNSFAGAGSTTLFDLDTANDRLYTQVPSTGVLTTVGSLTDGATASEAGFDIDGLSGTGYAALKVGADTGLYTVALPTSFPLLPAPQAARIGSFVLGNVIDIAAAPARIGFAGTDFTVPEAGGAATITVTRTGDLSEAASADYATSNGTATAGSDYTEATGTVTFPANAATATINVPITAETLPDGDEDFGITLSNPSATALLADRAATVTIDNDDQGALIYGLTDTDRLAQIRVADGIIGTPTQITGLAAGDDVVGIDVRPATGQLYAVVDGTTADTIYTINPGNAVATKVADLSAQLSGARFGVDVNPVPDRIRVVSNTGTSVRIVPSGPTAGAVTADTGLAYAGGSPTPDVEAVAYTNSVGGASSTTLYDLDLTADAIVLQSPPNDGTLTTLSPLGVAASGEAGFDIDAGTGTGYASLLVDGTVGLYTVALPSVATPGNAAARISSYGMPGIEDITVATPRYSVAPVTVAEGGVATFTVTRSGDLSETTSVTYATSDGTAAAGLDYVAKGATLTFAPNVSSQSFTVATALDAVAEADETATVTLSAPSTGSVLASTTATLTITEVPPSIVSLTFGPQLVDETAGTVTIPVTRTNPGIATAVNYTTANGGATAGADYVAKSGTVVFAVGDATEDIVIALLDDTRVEGNESFGVFLSNPSPGAALGQAQAVVTTVSEDVKRATSLSELVVPQVQSPEQTVISGRLTDANGNAVGGATVYVVSAPRDDSSPLRIVRTLTTQPNGLYSTLVRPTVHSKFIAVFNGDSQLAGSFSETKVVLVKFSTPTVTGPTTVAAGGTATVRGLVQPGNSRPKVLLQYLTGGRWVTLVGPVTVAPDGTYALSRVYRNRGTFQLRVAAPGTPLNGGAVSRAFTLKVI